MSLGFCSVIWAKQTKRHLAAEIVILWIDTIICRSLDNSNSSYCGLDTSIVRVSSHWTWTWTLHCTFWCWFSQNYHNSKSSGTFLCWLCIYGEYNYSVFNSVLELILTPETDDIASTLPWRNMTRHWYWMIRHTQALGVCCVPVNCVLVVFPGGLFICVFIFQRWLDAGGSD